MLPELKTVLCAVDLGRHAQRVLRHALSLASRYDGDVAVVHAVEPLGPQARHMAELYAHGETSPEAEERRWRELQASLLERLRALCAAEPCGDAGGRDLVAGIRVERGRPDEVILREAGRLGADVIVLGTHGHSAVGELLLGSTAHRVAQKSPVPVLLVRTAARDAAGGL